MIEFKLLEKNEAQEFIDFFDKLVSETEYLLPIIDETCKTKEKQEVSIEEFGDFKQVFIAKQDNKIVGFLGITRLRLNKSKHIANFAMGVLDEYKRRHIATRLLDITEKWLKKHKVFRFEMTVISENKPAIRLYKKIGFKKEGLREKSIFMNNKYYDEFYMSKFL